MRKVRILERNDERVRFAVLDERGVEVEQRALPVAPLAEKARKQRKSLEFVLGREVGAVVSDPEPTLAVVTTQSDSLSLDDLDLYYAAKDHEHEYAPRAHDHESTVMLRDALQATDEALSGLKADAEARLKAVERGLTHHDHDVPAHSHPSIQAQIEALQEAVRGLESLGVKEHTHSGFLTAEQLTGALSGVRDALVQLQEYVTSIENRVNSRIDNIPRPVLPEVLSREDVQAMIDASKPKLGKRTFTLESEQEVAGKAQYVLREV